MKREKKKPASAKKRAIRGATVLAILAAMAAFITTVPNTTPLAEATNPTEEEMNRSLDSLIRSLGFEKYKVTYKGKHETITEEPYCRSETLLDLTEERIRQTEEKEMNPIKKDAALEEEYTIRDSLKKEIQEFRKNNKATSYYARRIRMTTPDGKNWTFFQKLKDNRTSADAFHESK